MSEQYVIVIDPGHGGADPGAVAGVVREKDLNLSFALKLSEEIESKYIGKAACELTRDGDTGMTLQERGKVSLAFGASLVVSIHCNASTTKKAQGLCCFARKVDTIGHRVGRAICDAAPKEIRRGSSELISSTGLDWTKRTHAVLSVHRCPAVLVECAFLSNDDDRAYLLSRDGQEAVVAAMLAGVDSYIGGAK